MKLVVEVEDRFDISIPSISCPIYGPSGILRHNLNSYWRRTLMGIFDKFEPLAAARRALAEKASSPSM